MTFDHVCFGVDDLEAMVQWYTYVLGFQLERRWTFPQPLGWEGVYLCKEGVMKLEMIAGGQGERYKSADNIMQQLQTRGVNHIAFRIADIDAEFEALSSKVDVLMAPRDSKEAGVRAASRLSHNFLTFRSGCASMMKSAKGRAIHASQRTLSSLVTVKLCHHNCLSR
jgi:catechol 2,3-dioxygenase-like lactoylglutathione lyase family enzyme